VHAWSEFTRALNCAKVIKLPSHSVLATQFERKKNENGEERRTCFCKQRRSLQNSGTSRLFPSAFPFCSCAPRSALFLQQIWEDESCPTTDLRGWKNQQWRRWFTVNVNCWVFFCFSCCRDEITARTILVCVYVAFFFFALYVLLCFFFSFSVFFFGFLGWFFLSPFLTMYYFSGFLALFLLWFCFYLFFPTFSRFSFPFYRDSQAASFNQFCLCRIVICHERDRGRETWSTIGSNPLQIFSLLNRDGEDEHDCSTSNDNVSAANDIFILTLERF